MTQRRHMNNSKRRRIERDRRAGRESGPLPDEAYMVAPGWARDETELEYAKQATHDNVIRLIGNARTGPVSWRISEPPEAFDVVSMLIRDGSGGGSTDSLRRIRGLLREFGGYLVVAAAPGYRPGTPGNPT